MGYKSSFLDNETYGAEDVSRIFSHIVSDGVIAYPENTTLVDALNEMTAEITSEGVGDYTGLLVTKTENGIRVGEGVGFFKSGVAVEVDVEGAELEIESTSSVYVYFIAEPDFNRVRLCVSELPPEGDVLMLAEVLADGSVIDMREFARCKIIPPTVNYYHDFSVTHQMFGEYNERNENNTTYYRMPHGGFRYMILRDVKASVIKPSLFGNLIDLSADGEQDLMLTSSTTDAHVRVLKTGDELRIASIRYNRLTDEHTMYFTLV